MAIVQMQKVAVLALSPDREEIIVALHEEGVLHIVEHERENRIDHTEVKFKRAELEYAIGILKENAAKETLNAMAKPSTVDEITHAATHTDVLGIVNQLRSMEERDTETNGRLQELKTLRQELSPWTNLPYDIETSNTSLNCVRIEGTLPTVHFDELKDRLYAELPRNVLERIGVEDGLTSCYAVLWKDDAARFEEIATTLGWTTIELPEVQGSVRMLYEEAVMEEKRLMQGIESNREKRRELAIELPNLIKVSTFMNWLDQKQEARESMVGTADTVTLFGWVPKKNVDLLEDHLQKISPSVTVLKVKPTDGEEAPVHIKNSKLVTPFQSVTSLYGLPTQKDMDPTAALSPFFALYFALCLTDAGYGMVLALVFGAYLLKSKKTVEEATLPWLLFISGIMAFIVGIPFGGYFGLAPEAMPSFLTKQTAEGLMFKGQVWNLNAESGVEFLRNLSVVLGLTHLFFGMFLAGWHKWVHGNKAAAFWQDFTSHILLAAVLFSVFAPQSMSGLAKGVLYVSIALMIWGKGHGTKWYLRPIAGALGVVNFAIGLLSNGLSYLRILALGLVTGAIAMAINQVAVEIGRLLPVWLAIPVIVLIFIMGHLVSIALNVLGSFIHSARLQFIEFFSQFFEGGGKPYRPFRRTT